MLSDIKKIREEIIAPTNMEAMALNLGFQNGWHFIEPWYGDCICLNINHSFSSFPVEIK